MGFYLQIDDIELPHVGALGIMGTGKTISRVF
jgi:hypothetical protein